MRLNFFSTKYVDDWLNRQEVCKVPRCAKTVGTLGRRHSELLNADDLENLPSSWRTLNGYFNYLCKLDILMYSDRDWKNSGSSYFWIIDKIPEVGQCNVEDDY